MRARLFSFTGTARKQERMETAGEWLEKALVDLCKRIESLDLDGEVISGLVSYCELAQPLDAKEYLDVIIFFSLFICLIYSVNFCFGSGIFFFPWKKVCTAVMNFGIEVYMVVLAFLELSTSLWESNVKCQILLSI